MEQAKERSFTLTLTETDLNVLSVVISKSTAVEFGVLSQFLAKINGQIQEQLNPVAKDMSYSEPKIMSQKESIPTLEVVE